MSQVKSPFGASATALVLWEGAALVTEDLQRHGLILWRVPYVSELLRRLPKSARAGCSVGVGIVLWEHLEYMSLTKAASSFVSRKRRLRVQQVR